MQGKVALHRAALTFRRNGEYATRKSRDYNRRADKAPRATTRRLYQEVARKYDGIAVQACEHIALIDGLVMSLDGVHVHHEVARALSISATILEAQDVADSWDAIECIKDILDNVNGGQRDDSDEDATEAVLENLPDVPIASPGGIVSQSLKSGTKQSRGQDAVAV
jgi:urease gamma subunit